MKNVANKLELEVIIKLKDAKINELSEKIKILEKSFASMLKKVEELISNEQNVKDSLEVVDSIRTKVDQNTEKIKIVDKAVGQLINKQEEDKTSAPAKATDAKATDEKRICSQCGKEFERKND